MVAVCQESEESTLRLFLTEARTVNQALSDENLQLRSELKESQDELARLRSRYAAMVVENDRRAASLAKMDAAAAAILRGTDAEKSRLQLLEVLGDFRRRLLEAGEKQQKLLETVATLIEVCKPSEALAGMCEREMADSREAFAQCLKPLSDAETLPDERTAATSVEIAAADAEAGMVRLDRGETAGVRVGRRLAPAVDSGTQTRLRVILARPNAAVAVIEEGDPEKLLPGVLLKMLPD